MIPNNNDGLQVAFEFAELPTHTFRLHALRDIVAGFTDQTQAMVQAIYLILNVPRYEHLIYSWNYGVEFSDLIGQQIAFCVPEIKRRITEALTQDSRILAVDNFIFDTGRGTVHATFTAHTIFGDIDAERMVEV